MQYLKTSDVRNKNIFSISEVFNIGDNLFSKLCRKYSRRRGYNALPVRSNCVVLNVIDDLYLTDENCSNEEQIEELIMQRDSFNKIFPSPTLTEYASFYCKEAEQEFFLITPQFNLDNFDLIIPSQASITGLCSLDELGMPVLLISNEQFKKKLTNPLKV